jgi:hypothetical protein
MDVRFSGRTTRKVMFSSDAFEPWLVRTRIIFVVP